MTEPDDDWVLVGTSGIEKLSDEEEKRLQEWKQSRDIWNARIADGSATTYGQAYTEEPYTEEPVPVPEPEPVRTLPIEGTLHPSRVDQLRPPHRRGSSSPERGYGQAMDEHGEWFTFKVTHVVPPNNNAVLLGFPGALTEEGIRVLGDDGTTILDEVTTEIINIGKWSNYQRTKKAQTLMRKLNEDEEKTG